MEEVLKALGPFPVAQGVVIGLLVAAAGFWAIRRGLQDSRRSDGGETPRAVRIEHTDEEKRWQWEAYKQLETIDLHAAKMAEHSKDIVDLLKTIANGINRIGDSRWNSRQ